MGTRGARLAAEDLVADEERDVRDRALIVGRAITGLSAFA